MAEQRRGRCGAGRDRQCAAVLVAVRREAERRSLLNGTPGSVIRTWPVASEITWKIRFATTVPPLVTVRVPLDALTGV